MGKGKNLRINNWVNQIAYFTLERLAKHYGVTKKEMLEKLIIEKEEELKAHLSDDDFYTYFKL